MMELLGQSFFDNPVPLLAALGVIWIGLLAGWWAKRDRRLMIGLLVTPVVGAAAVLASWMVQTPEEDIEQRTEELAAIVMRNDWPKVQSYLADDFDGPYGNKEQMLLLAKTVVRRMNVNSAKIVSNNVEFVEDIAVSRVKAKINYDGELGPSMYVTGWMVYWARRDNDWKIISVRPEQPLPHGGFP